MRSATAETDRCNLAQGGGRCAPPAEGTLRVRGASHVASSGAFHRSWDLGRVRSARAESATPGFPPAATAGPFRRLQPAEPRTGPDRARTTKPRTEGGARRPVGLLAAGDAEAPRPALGATAGPVRRLQRAEPRTGPGRAPQRYRSALCFGVFVLPLIFEKRRVLFSCRIGEMGRTGHGSRRLRSFWLASARTSWISGACAPARSLFSREVCRF